MNVFQSELSRNTLRLPRSSLQRCIRCILTRETVAATNSSRILSIFPSTPFPGLTWTIRGKRNIVERGGRAHFEPLEHRTLFYGVRSNPITCIDSTGLVLFDVVFQPDAPHVLLGLDAEDYFEQRVDADTVLPLEWQEMASAIHDAPNHIERQTILEDFLEPRWKAASLRAELKSNAVTDWLENVVTRAMLSKPGSSLRQFERRFKRMTGVSRKFITTLSRGEQTLLAARDIIFGDIDLNWARLAVSLGYTDQSHLCREIKRLTGYTPEELRKMGKNKDDALWAFHLWG